MPRAFGRRGRGGWQIAAPSARRSSALPLLLPGGGLVLIALAYLRVAGLLDHYHQPKLRLNHLGGWSEVTVGVALLVAGAFGCYYAAWRLAARLAPTRRRIALVCGVAAVLAGILAWTYPLFSDDLFYGIAGARTLTHYGQNPYLVPPSAFPADPFLPYAGWRDLTMPYGPLWVLISGATAWLGDYGLLGTVLAFKALYVAVFLLTTVLLARLLTRHSPRTALAGLILWAWNPLVLLEIAGNGHNDIIMLLLLVAACGFIAARRVTPALLMLALAIAAKYVAIVLVPFFALHVVRQRGDWRAGLRLLLPGALASGALLGALYGVLWAGVQTFGPINEAHHTYGSISAIARAVLPFRGVVLREVLVRGATLLLFVGCYGWLLRRGGRSLRDLFAAGHGALLALLLCWPLFMPWYAIWLVPLAALVGKPRLAHRTMLLTATAMATYLCQFPLRIPFRQPSEFWSTLSALIVFGSLLALTAAPYARVALRRRSRRSGRLAGPLLET